jgi:hypothetical protein
MKENRNWFLADIVRWQPMFIRLLVVDGLQSEIPGG